MSLRFFKLDTGETLVADMIDQDDNTVTLRYPGCIGTTLDNNIYAYRFLRFTNDSTCVISKHHIVFSTLNVTSATLEFYNAIYQQYIDQQAIAQTPVPIAAGTDPVSNALMIEKANSLVN